MVTFAEQEGSNIIHVLLDILRHREVAVAERARRDPILLQHIDQFPMSA
jgi:hypothetical protein